ncbi:hypothetical protein I8J38_00505 [Bacillus sp. OA1]|nr:hypothetical protein [Bacillus sp. OA1]
MVVTKPKAKKVTSLRLSWEAIEKLEKMIEVYQEVADEQAKQFGMVSAEIRNHHVVESCINKEYERLEKEGRI